MNDDRGRNDQPLQEVVEGIALSDDVTGLYKAIVAEGGIWEYDPTWKQDRFLPEGQTQLKFDELGGNRHKVFTVRWTPESR